MNFQQIKRVIDDISGIKQEINDFQKPRNERIKTLVDSIFAGIDMQKVAARHTKARKLGEYGECRETYIGYDFEWHLVGEQVVGDLTYDWRDGDRDIESIDLHFSYFTDPNAIIEYEKEQLAKADSRKTDAQRAEEEKERQTYLKLHEKYGNENK